MIFRFFLGLSGVVVGAALERHKRRRRRSRKNPVSSAETSSALAFGLENARVLEACAETLHENGEVTAAGYLQGYAAAVREECGRRRSAVRRRVALL